MPIGGKARIKDSMFKAFVVVINKIKKWQMGRFK